MLGGPPADALAVTGEVEFFDLGAFGVGDADVDEAEGFAFVGTGAAAGTRYASDADADRGSGAGADALGEGAGDGFRDGTFGADEVLRDIGEGGFQGVRVDDRATEKVTRAAGDGGEPLGEHASGAALSGGKGEVTHAEHEQHDLVERLRVRGKDVVGHLVLDGFGEGVDAGFRFREGGLGAFEVELDLAIVGEDGGLDVGVLLVDRRGAVIDGGLRDEGHAELAAGEKARGQGGEEARFDLVGEHGLELFGRAGEQDDGARLGVDEGVEELAGSAAVFVFEQDRAFEDVGLLGVVGRHGDAALGEAALKADEGGVVAAHADAKRGGGGFAGEVVLGGAEAAGKEDEVGAGEGHAGGSGEVLERVADNGFEGDLDAEVVELRGEVEGVGVLAEGGEHLRADGDDFSEHAG